MNKCNNIKNLFKEISTHDKVFSIDKIPALCKNAYDKDKENIDNIIIVLPKE